jgi:hypothetical protein
MRVKPIDAIRYELDRVLGASGKPISLQFDDRTDQQRLVGYEELYDLDTTPLADCLTGGKYSYGVGVAGNNGTPMAYGNAVYHWEMDQDYRPAIWGHQVSVNHLTSKGEEVVGELKAKLAAKLGIQGDVLQKGGSRLSIPMAGQDALFQTEMGVTRGWVLIDSDYRAYDNPDILNRKHVTIAITGADNRDSLHSIIPNNSVVMGFEHRLNRKSAYTRLHLRRGS